MSQARQQPVDEAIVRAVHRKFVTGVTVVAAMDCDDRPAGLAVNAFVSVSLNPPIVLVCINKSSRTLPVLLKSPFIGVSILSNRQADVVTSFATPGGNKFEGIEWKPGPFGSPILSGSAAWVEISVVSRLDASTHVALVAQIIAADHTEEIPLVYSNGGMYDAATLQPPG